MPTESVRMLARFIIVNASRNSSQALTKARIAAVNTPGADSGMTTLNNAPMREQPSIIAAASRSGGISWKKLDEPAGADLEVDAVDDLRCAAIHLDDIAKRDLGHDGRDAGIDGSAGARLREAAVDDEVVAGDCTRFVGSEEQDRAGNVVLGQSEFEALAVDELALELRREPQPDLPLGKDRSRNDRIDADVMDAELAREHARQAADRRLGGRIDDHSRGAAHP